MAKPYFLFWYLVSPEQLEDPTIAPHKIEMRNSGLKPRPIIRFGQKQSTIYYRDYDFETGEYLQPIFKCDRAVTYDQRNNPISITRTVAWMMSNNQWGGSKTYTDPIYSPLKFLEKRRARIIDELKDLAAKFSSEQLPLEKNMIGFFEQNQILINTYIFSGSTLLLEAVRHSSVPWIDLEIVGAEEGSDTARKVMLQYFAIATVETERKASINSETLTEDRQLTSGDSETQNFIVNSPALKVLLPTDPNRGLKFNIINNPTSTQNLTIEGVEIQPGDNHKIQFDGENWIVL